MQISRRNFPENQELVIGVVNRILKHGVYITLKEYKNMEGYCHISEVAGAWIRNIRNFVRIDQTVAAKVLRVNRDTRQVDLSLKRVSDAAKKEKNQAFKKQVAALAMLLSSADVTVSVGLKEFPVVMIAIIIILLYLLI